MKNRAQPGEIIREDVIGTRNLSVTAAAAVLGVGRNTLSRLLNGNAALTPERAIRIEKAFGPKAEHLLRVQLAYDLARARKREDEIDVRRFQSAS